MCLVVTLFYCCIVFRCVAINTVYLLMDMFLALEIMNKAAINTCL